MEIIIGFIVIFIVVKIVNAAKHKVDNSKSPVVRSITRVVGTVAIASLAKDAYNSKRRKK